MTDTVAPPSGKTWWYAYDDGCVWPVELLDRPTVLVGHAWIRPLVPAPDAGKEYIVLVGRVYDAQFTRPDGRKVRA